MQHLENLKWRFQKEYSTVWEGIGRFDEKEVEEQWTKKRARKLQFEGDKQKTKVKLVEDIRPAPETGEHEWIDKGDVEA